MYNFCFVTCLYAESLEQADSLFKFKKIPNIDYYMFTNLSNIEHITSWKPIYLENDFIEEKNNIVKSRYGKFMAWKYFEKHSLKYSYIIYCDNIYTPIPNKNKFDQYIKKLINGKQGIFQIKHKCNLTEELQNILKLKKATPEACLLAENYLIEKNMDMSKQIVGNTMFIYDTNNTKICEAFSFFWNLYVNEYHFLLCRDQPLWAYVLFKLSISPTFDSNDKGYPLSPFLKLFVRSKNLGFNNHTYV